MKSSLDRAADTLDEGLLDFRAWLDGASGTVGDWTAAGVEAGIHRLRQLYAFYSVLFGQDIVAGLATLITVLAVLRLLFACGRLAWRAWRGVPSLPQTVAKGAAMGVTWGLGRTIVHARDFGHGRQAQLDKLERKQAELAKALATLEQQNTRREGLKQELQQQLERLRRERQEWQAAETRSVAEQRQQQRNTELLAALEAKLAKDLE